MKRYVYVVFVLLVIFILNGCGHEHVYSDATCTTPKTCIECDKTEGEALGHIFLEATCDTPEMCERCNFIGQEALGHTTKIGKCNNCNKFQGEDIINNILEKLTYANAQSDLALTVQTSGTDYYEDFLSGISYYESAKVEYESALDLCGNYPELATLRKDIQNLIDALPLTVYGSDEESLNLYFDDLTSFFTLQAECQLTMIFVENLIQ